MVVSASYRITVRVFNSGNNNGPLLSHPASLFSLFILVYVVRTTSMHVIRIFVKN